MSIKLTPFNHGELYHGFSWAVQDEDLLADQIARVAVGQSRHVAKILAGAQLGPAPTTAFAVASAIASQWARDRRCNLRG